MFLGKGKLLLIMPWQAYKSFSKSESYLVFAQEARDLQ